MVKTVLILLFECTPITVFFLAGKLADFHTATSYFISMTFVSILLVWFLAKRVPYLSLIFGSYIGIFGTLSIIFDAPQVLIFADSLYYFTIAATITWFQLHNRNIMRRLFQNNCNLPSHLWNTLAWQWVYVFVLAGASNELVRHFFTPQFWIDFQFARGLLIVCFVLYQLIQIQKYHNILKPQEVFTPPAI